MPFSIRLFSSGISHRRTDMKFKLVFALFPLILLELPSTRRSIRAYACNVLRPLRTVEKCLDEAISHEIRLLVRRDSKQEAKSL